MAQAGQDPAFDQEHPGLNFCLVPWFVRPGRDHGAAIMGGHLQVGGVDFWLLAVGPGHPSAQVVRHQDLRNSPQVLEQVDVGRDPVEQLLGGQGLDVGVVAGPQDAHKQLGRSHHSGDRIVDGQGRAGEVQEQLLTRSVVLAQHHVQPPLPLPGVLDELGVLVALGTALFELHPEQLQGHPLTPQLPVDLGPAPAARDRQSATVVYATPVADCLSRCRLSPSPRTGMRTSLILRMAIRGRGIGISPRRSIWDCPERVPCPPHLTPPLHLPSG